MFNFLYDPKNRLRLICYISIMLSQLACLVCVTSSCVIFPHPRVHNFLIASLLKFVTTNSKLLVVRYESWVVLVTHEYLNTVTRVSLLRDGYLFWTIRRVNTGVKSLSSYVDTCECNDTCETVQRWLTRMKLYHTRTI